MYISICIALSEHVLLLVINERSRQARAQAPRKPTAAHATEALGLTLLMLVIHLRQYQREEFLSGSG